jgi:predicted HTH transcriptional regulator
MERDPSTGQIQQEYEDEEFVDAVRENEPATTKEVMETVGVSRTAALYRLNKLEDEDVLMSKEAGTSLVWTVIE